MICCLFRLLFLAIGFVALAIFVGCQIFVQHAGGRKIYTNIESLPAREVGLVLGTTRLRRGGGVNLYFKARVDAAAQLFHRGKVKKLLLSGDAENDEPRDMKNALFARGVPAKAILLDTAGVRTLDSIVRAKKVFGFSKFTIISQREHDARALLIARHFDLDAIAFAAADVPFHRAMRAHIHEWFARVKVVLDLYVLHTQPTNPN